MEIFYSTRRRRGSKIPMIRVKRIYNFWVIHANFVILSHVSIIISHHFYAFCWTNLLTRCPVPVPCFCYFCISEIYFGKYSRNWTKIYGDFLCEIRHLKTEGQPRRWTTGHGRPPAVDQGGPMGGTCPCPWATSSAPSDAYKIRKNLNTSGRLLFST